MNFAKPKLVTIKVVIIVCACSVVGLYLYVHNPFISNLKINEVSFKNDEGFDWVEVYNPSIHTLSLKGMYLTDDKLDLEKFRIEDDIIIGPGGFVIFYGESYDGLDAVNMTMNFSIKNGETIYLIDKSNLKTVDSLTVLAEDASTTGTSIGRFPDGSENTFFLTQSTMGTSNQKDPIPGINDKR